MLLRCHLTSSKRMRSAMYQHTCPAVTCSYVFPTLKMSPSSFYSGHSLSGRPPRTIHQSSHYCNSTTCSSLYMFQKVTLPLQQFSVLTQYYLYFPFLSIGIFLLIFIRKLYKSYIKKRLLTFCVLFIIYCVCFLKTSHLVYFMFTSFSSDREG